MISALINKTDTAELARDAVAQILADESANQAALAVAESLDPAPWTFDVFRERTAPMTLNHNDAPAIVVNLERTAEAAAATTSHQDYTVDVAVLVYTCAKGSTTQPADEAASLRRAQTVRIVRNILAASEYTYLNMRKLVASSRVSAVTYYDGPTGQNESGSPTLAAELRLTVLCREYAPAVSGVSLDEVGVTLKTGANGQVVAQLDYTYGS